MATDTAPAAAQSGPFLRGSIIWEKKGPLPVWAWALIVLGLVLAITMWRRNKAGSDATEVATGDEPLPGDQMAPPIFIVPQAATPAVTINNTPPATVPTAPPGAGREAPPGTVPKPAPPVVKKTKVTVAKYTTKNPPWNSTLSGIFAHFKGTTTATNWQAIWQSPLNADIRAKRGTYNKIQPGDTIWVPVR